MPHPHVLLIDDDPDLRQALADTIQFHLPDVTVTTAESGEKGLGALGDREYDLVLCDLLMPGMGGAEIIPEIRERVPGVPVYLLTGHLYPEQVYRHVGAMGFIKKPIERKELIEILRQSLAAREYSKAVSSLVARAQARASDAAKHVGRVVAELESRRTRDHGPRLSTLNEDRPQSMPPAPPARCTSHPSP